MADLQERRRKSAEGLGLSATDVELLDERFDWSMEALVEWKRRQGEGLPEAIESFGTRDRAPAEAANEPSIQEGVRTPEGADVNPDEETPERRAAILNREVQIGQRVADFLDANELAGGHTLAEHVGCETEYLETRARSLKGGEASAFFDRSQAEMAISEALSDRGSSDAIDQWLGAGGYRFAVSADVSEVAGIVIDGTGEMRLSSRVVVVLRRVEDDYRIHTAYLT